MFYIISDIILSLTLVEGKKPRKCCYYSFFRLFILLKSAYLFRGFGHFKNFFHFFCR